MDNNDYRIGVLIIVSIIVVIILSIITGYYHKQEMTNKGYIKLDGYYPKEVLNLTIVTQQEEQQ